MCFVAHLFQLSTWIKLFKSWFSKEERLNLLWFPWLMLSINWLSENPRSLLTSALCNFLGTPALGLSTISPLQPSFGAWWPPWNIHYDFLRPLLSVSTQVPTEHLSVLVRETWECLATDVLLSSRWLSHVTWEDTGWDEVTRPQEWHRWMSVAWLRTGLEVSRLHPGPEGTKCPRPRKPQVLEAATNSNSGRNSVAKRIKKMPFSIQIGKCQTTN